METSWKDWMRVGGVVLWIAYLITVAFFHASTGDEGAYHVPAVRIAAGQFPVLEMYTQMPVWTYLPFSAIAKWISPQVEALRLYSVFAVVAVTLMVTVMVERWYGRPWTYFAFCLMAFSWPWAYHNLEVRHSVSANLGLVLAFFFLFFFRSRPLLTAFLAGIGMALAINSRVVLIPVAVLAAVLLFTHARKDEDRETRFKSLLAAGLGVLIPSIPSFVILFIDAEALFFNYLLARVEWVLSTGQMIIPEGVIGKVVWFVQTRATAIAGLFWGFSRTGGMWQNSVILLPFIAAAVLALTRGSGLRRPIWRFLTDDRPLNAALWMVLGIIVSHTIADMITFKYFHHAIPFLIIASMGVGQRAALMARESATPQWFSVKGFLHLPLSVALVPYALWYGGMTGTDLIRRAEPSISRPMTSSRVSCWLEKNTSEDAVVMSYFGVPGASAGRKQTPGFEQSQGVASLFWFRLSQEKADRFRILTAEDYRRRLAMGDIPVVIHDPTIDGIIDKFTDLAALMQRHYRLIASTGGTWSYDIYVHKSIDSSAMTHLLRKQPLRINQEKLNDLIRGGAYFELGRDLLLDTLDSLKTLPSDWREALARATGGDFDTRCTRLLEGSSSVARRGKNAFANPAPLAVNSASAPLSS